MADLSRAPNDQFWRDGFIVVENAVSPAPLAARNAQLDLRIEESRSHTSDFSETINGKATAAE